MKTPGIEKAASRAASAVHQRASLLHRMHNRGIEYADVVTVVPLLTVALQYPHVLDGDVVGGAVLSESAATTRAAEEWGSSSSLTGSQLLTEGAPPDGDFRLTQTLRWWDIQFGIQPGDVLTMLLLPENEWLAFDVRSHRNIDAGVRHNRPPLKYGDPVRPLETVPHDPLLEVVGTASASGSVGDSFAELPVDLSGVIVRWVENHIVKKMEVFDAEGVLVGYVPVFKTLPGPVA